MTTAIPFQQQNEIFRKMQELSEFINMSSEDQDKYELELDKYITYIGSLKYAKNEGAMEERLKNAKAMKDNGVAVETIMKCINLTKEEIEKL